MQASDIMSTPVLSVAPDTSPWQHAGLVLLATLVLGAIAGCGEKAPRVISGADGAYNLQTGSAIAERTRNQGESERIAY
jgi:hypothetical protein